MMLWLLILQLAALTLVRGDYQCLCSYTVERTVYQRPDNSSSVIGYMYEFDCNPTANVTTGPKWTAIVMDRQVGYLVRDARVQTLTCQGSPHFGDTLPSTTQPPATTAPSTTITTTPSTTPTTMSTTTTRKPTATTTTTTTTRRPSTTTTTTGTRSTTTTTTRRPTTKSTTTTTTTRRPTTKSTTTIRRYTTTTTTTRRPTTPSTTATTTRRTTTPSTTTTRKTTTTTTPTSTTTKRPFVKGNTKLCPDHAKNDVNRQHSILAQYGEFCYEIVHQNASWNYSEQYCELRGGNLIHIIDQAHQDYIHTFLQQQHIAQQVWIGLNDIEKEGKYVWSTGDPVTYTHYSVWHIFKLTHNIADCFVMQKKDGKWDDISCGLDHFTNLQNSHGNPWICQYHIPSSLPSIGDFFKKLIG